MVTFHPMVHEITCRQTLFWLNFGGLSLTVTLKIRSRSPKPIQLFIMSKCYIHANPVKIRQLVHEILCTQATFGSNLAVYVLQTLKKRPWSPKSNQLFIMSQCYIHANLVEIPTNSWDMVHTSTFRLKFGSLSPAVTFKIRSRSPKPNQLFIMSQCYIHANLVKIHPPVHEISCKQESVTPTSTPTESSPKTICPPPLWWGT